MRADAGKEDACSSEATETDTVCSMVIQIGLYWIGWLRLCVV